MNLENINRQAVSLSTTPTFVPGTFFSPRALNGVPSAGPNSRRSEDSDPALVKQMRQTLLTRRETSLAIQWCLSASIHSLLAENPILHLLLKAIAVANILNHWDCGPSSEFWHLLPHRLWRQLEPGRLIRRDPHTIHLGMNNQEPSRQHSARRSARRGMEYLGKNWRLVLKASIITPPRQETKCGADFIMDSLVVVTRDSSI